MGVAAPSEITATVERALIQLQPATRDRVRHDLEPVVFHARRPRLETEIVHRGGVDLVGDTTYEHAPADPAVPVEPVDLHADLRVTNAFEHRALTAAEHDRVVAHREVHR